MKPLEIVTTTLVLLASVGLGALFRWIAHRWWNTPETVAVREFVGTLLVLVPPTLVCLLFQWPILWLVFLLWGSAGLIGVLVLACDRAFGVVGKGGWDGLNPNGELKRQAKHQLEDLSAEIIRLLMDLQTTQLRLDEQEIKAAEALVRTTDLRKMVSSSDKKTVRQRAVHLLARLEEQGSCQIAEDL